MEPNAGSKPYNQRRMGPAPFASFEDLSDEMESPSDEKDPTSSIIRLPGITEQDSNMTSPVDPKNHCQLVGISLIGSVSRNAFSSSQNSVTHSPLLNKIKPTPRIDISRASSSSHQDSRDSTPEREICDSIEENNAKLGLGFKEDGALELRLSTEELDFQESTEKKKHKTRNQTPSPEPDELYANNRKDSQCSDVILLCISGRTSRLSSIGSQGSAKSRLSNASHFSVTSGQSAYSQCSSPHKTILETSFCGYKLSSSHISPEQDENKEDTEEFEKVLLSRKSNLTEGVLVEGLQKQMPSDKPPDQVGLKQSHAINGNDIQDNLNEKKVEKSAIPKKIISKSGVEYIYIPLKGPLPTDDSEAKSTKRTSQATSIEQNRKRSNGNINQTNNKKVLNNKDTKPRSTPFNSAETSSEQPKYIRIKLKPDHCYEDESSEPSHNITKPMCLNLSLKKERTLPPKLQFEHQITSVVEQKQTRSLTNTPSVSPKLIRRNSKGSSTPSPSVPRRNSFASIFRTGAESPSSLKRKRKGALSSIIKTTNTCRKGRSKSIDKNKSFFPITSSSESVDSKGKANSVLSIFKTNTKEKSKSKDNTSSQDVKFKPNNGFKGRKTADKSQESPLNSQSIRIPLHSPTYYAKKEIFEEITQAPKMTVKVESNETNSNNLITSKQKELNKNTGNKNNDQIACQSSNTDYKWNLDDNDFKFETENNHVLTSVPNTPLLNSKQVNSLENKEVVKAATSDNSLTMCQDIMSDDDKNEIIEITPNVETQNIQKHSKNEADRQNNGIDDDHNSSESERDLDLEYSKSNNLTPHLKMNVDSLEIERKAIVLQQDSFEDELPYIPTTLPLERSAAIPILPIKQRCVLDVKTCQIERPRSTTPIHSSGLENYIDGFIGKSELKENRVTKKPEKIKILLPRTDSTHKSRSLVVTTTSSDTEDVKTKEDTPPPLPPKGIQRTWINFEEVPERRKPPKRIQTIPSRGHIDISGLVLKDHVVYTYVNPEECKCECHEHKEQENDTIRKSTQEEKLPLLDLENNGPNSSR